MTTSNPSPATTPDERKSLKWAYPFALNKNGDRTSARPYFTALSETEDGFYPLGANGLWHGGIHFNGDDKVLNEDGGVRAIADGTVVAYRLDTKYPELTYPDKNKVIYSSGFVLIHHKLMLPALRTANSDTSRTATGPVPADEVLDFYSLYMHLLDWTGYQAAEAAVEQAAPALGSDGTSPVVQRMPYWKGDSRFRVGKQAPDQQMNSAMSTSVTDADPLGDFISNDFQAPADAQSVPLLKGLHIHKAPADHAYLGLLPIGSEITIESPDPKHPKWARIAAIKKGQAVPKDVAKALDPAAATGYVFIPGLESVIDPSPLDSVVVLDTPFPIAAGAVVGYLGEYQRYRDGSPMPPVRHRKQVHVEVFAGDAFKAFLAKSRERAEKLPATQKNVLVVSAGAMLVQPTEHETKPTVAEGLLLKPTKDAPTAGQWTKVQPTQITTTHVAHSHHANRSEHSVGAAVWVERSSSGTAMSANTKVWTTFPLELANAKAPTVAFQEAVSRASLDKYSAAYHAQDDSGVNWWMVFAGGEKRSQVCGWVCEKDHPHTQWQSPYAWPGFDVIDGSNVGLLDFAKRHYYMADRLLEGERESFAPTAMSVNGSDLLTKLEKAIEQPSRWAGKVNARALALALTYPWLANALSHLVVRYDSEWGGDMSKWDTLSSIMGTGKSVWQTELQRIEKLQWWDQVSSVKGFPSSPTVYHFHPVGLVGNFSTLSIPLAELRVRAFLSVIRHGEGTEDAAGYSRLFGGKSFIRDYDKDFSDHPRIKITETNHLGHTYTSTAAGAYQILERTWDDMKQFSNFSPENQDRAAVLRLQSRGALTYIEQGEIEVAIRGAGGKNEGANKEWASQPESPYGQPTMTMAVAKKLFAEYLAKEATGISIIVAPIGNLIKGVL